MSSRRLLRAGGFALLGPVLVPPVPAAAQVTQRASVDPHGVEGDGSSYRASTSADGRYVAFLSHATNLVHGDTNGFGDIFVKDRLTGQVRRVSVGLDGKQANGTSDDPSISADGRFVAFSSRAHNLVRGDTNGNPDVFVFDLRTEATVRASVSSSGDEALGGASVDPAISADGTVVAFSSWASNLVPGDTNADPDVFVHDLATGQTTRVSISSTGRQAKGGSGTPSISSGGRFVAFVSWASNLKKKDKNGFADVFRHDRKTGRTILVSQSSSGATGDGDSRDLSMSGDGSRIAFHSWATNLVPGDGNGVPDVFVRDVAAKTTARVSVDSSGAEGDSNSYFPSISRDGLLVALESDSTNLVPGDTNGRRDVFLRDLLQGKTWRASVRSNGKEARKDCRTASLSHDGRFVAFDSRAGNLVKGDKNRTWDVFVHGPELTLDVNRSSASPGDILEFTTWTGRSGDPALLYVLSVDGAPFTALVAAGSFDGSGLWPVSLDVPPGLTGSRMTFVAFARAPFRGKVEPTNQVPVSFL